MELDKAMEIIQGAMARGYCHPKNERKVLDPDLIHAMAVEVVEEVVRRRDDW
jgi:hypothetical protein